MSNSTTICGNLTREPEIRYTKEGQATTQLGVAVNRRWQDKTSGEWQEATSFFDVVCWRDLAENVALSLSKGMRVVVTGRSSSAAGRPTTASTAPRWRSWPTRSARRSASPPPMCAGRCAPLKESRSPPGRTTPRCPRSESASRAGSPARPGGPTRGTRHRSDRRANP